MHIILNIWKTCMHASMHSWFKTWNAAINKSALKCAKANMHKMLLYKLNKICFEPFQNISDIFLHKYVHFLNHNISWCINFIVWLGVYKNPCLFPFIFQFILYKLILSYASITVILFIDYIYHEIFNSSIYVIFPDTQKRGVGQQKTFSHVNIFLSCVERVWCE